MAPEPILLDYLAFIVFIVLSVGYHVFYIVAMRHHPAWSVRARMHEHRLHWIQTVQKRGERIMAVQSLRNLIMTNTFLASTMILLVAFTGNYFLLQPATDTAFTHPTPTYTTGAMPLVVKGIVLLILYAFAFVMFLSSLRTLNHLSLLISVEPEQLQAVESRDPALFLTEKLNETEGMTTYGRRAVYFSIPVFAWLFSPWLFLVFTIVMWAFFIVYMDFVSPFALKKNDPRSETGEAPAPQAAAPAPK